MGHDALLPNIMASHIFRRIYSILREAGESLRENRNSRTIDNKGGSEFLDEENETQWIVRARDQYTTRREENEGWIKRLQETERVQRNLESEEEKRARMEGYKGKWRDRPEEWLCDAATRGDVESLKEIMQIDCYILDKVLVGSFKGKNPLHMATSTGQKEFVLELLEYKQDLAKAVDTKLGTALHIASSKGHLEIVKLLVYVSPEMCMARDREGNNPLHIAAVKGNVEELKVLLRTNPRAARVKVDRGDNILHLCVNYNQLASLKLLLHIVRDKEFLNSTDTNGNNILHLAVFGKRREIIEYLLHKWPEERSRVDELGQLLDVNARNGSGWTALDIAKSEDRNRHISDVLTKYGVKRSDALFFPFDPYWQKKKKDTLIIVSSLMATMLFQVGINPPGGVWQETILEEHEAGKAVIAYTNPKVYPYLVCINTVGFLLSLTTILELIVVLPTKKRAFGFIRAGFSWLMIMIMAFAYTFSVIVVSPTEMFKSTNLVIFVTVTVWAVEVTFLRVLPFQVQVIVVTALFTALIALPMQVIFLVLSVVLLPFALLAGCYICIRPRSSSDQSTGETAPPPNPTAASQNDSTSVAIEE